MTLASLPPRESGAVAKYAIIIVKSYTLRYTDSRIIIRRLHTASVEDGTFHAKLSALTPETSAQWQHGKKGSRHMENFC